LNFKKLLLVTSIKHNLQNSALPSLPDSRHFTQKYVLRSN